MQRQFQSLTRILRLRYRLLWAQARLRNGKFVLYLIGCLILLLTLIIIQMGGIGAAIALMRSDDALAVTGVVLSACYFNALLLAVLLGFGMNSVFSDAVLRRYPILRMERFTARQIVSLLEPLWLLVLILYLGFAVGFSLFGAASLWLAIPAAVLLTVANYFPARILFILIERIMAIRHGPQILLVMVLFLFMLPSFLLRIDWKQSGILETSLPFLHLFPTFSASAVFNSKSMLGGTGWTFALLFWCLAFFAAVYYLDRLPIQFTHSEKGNKVENHPTCNMYDRVARFFNPEISPLIGKILRYYLRSPQLRFNYFAAFVLIVPFTLLLGGYSDEDRSFSVAAGYLSIAGYLSMGAMTSNMFGFDGSGFRRYFILPIRAELAVRAAATVTILLGVPIILVSIALWLTITPVFVDGRMLLWLFACGFSGLFLFQASGLWISMLAPRAIPFNTTFGNKLSFGANTLMILAICILFFLPNVLDYIGAETVLTYWWLGLILLTATIAFYSGTMHFGALYFSSHRERMLSTIERGC